MGGAIQNLWDQIRGTGEDGATVRGSGGTMTMLMKGNGA